MSEKTKRRFGDRRDGRRVKAPGLQTVMTCLMPNRTDAEVYLQDKIDVTDLLVWLEEKNRSHPEYKTTVFHCFVTAMARLCRERPLMNRFIQGGRMYERNEISLSFVAKKRFTDHSEEALMFLTPKDTDTLDDISRKIIGDVHEVRRDDHKKGGVDELLDKFAAMPTLLMMFLVWIVRCLDFWGVNPKFLTDGDPNYSTVLLSNLGSIQSSSVYHHLNNYGTNSIMLTIGTIHKEKVLMKDMSEEIRDIVDIGVTIDERIGDGFYFARSVKLIKHIFAHPELLEVPLGQESGFDYK